MGGGGGLMWADMGIYRPNGGRDSQALISLYKNIGQDSKIQLIYHPGDLTTYETESERL